MKEKQVVVATFSDLEKAQNVSNHLTQAGIPTEISDKSKLQKYWFLSRSLAADKVMVQEKDFERARSVLQAADAQDHILQGELLCPQCGSANIEYPQFTRRFITTTLVEIFCLLRVFEKAFFCKKCQHTWPASVALRPKTDLLNWPVKNVGLVKKEMG